MNTNLKIIYIFLIYTIYIMDEDYASKLYNYVISFYKYSIKYNFNHITQKYTLGEIIISIFELLKSVPQ
jgi:hypothetical protein